MRTISALVLMCVFAASADAQGVRDLLSRPTCPAGGCPQAATAQPVRAIVARPVAAVATLVSGAPKSDGWYLGKGLDRVFGADRPKLLPCRR